MKVENVSFEKNNWSVEVDGNIIRVKIENSTIKLFINEKLQDIYLSSMVVGTHLTGELSNGKDVKVSIGGDLKIHCYIFVNNELVLED